MVKIQIGTDGRVWKKEDGKPDLIIGYIKDKVYECQRDASEHLHFIHNGWGLDVDLLDDLIQRGIRIIHIYDKFFNENFYSELDMMKEFGIEEEYGENGRQVILPKEYWGVNPDYLDDSSGLVHLHVHSEYSTLDGLGHLEELVLKVRRMGMNALALTDHGNLFGMYKFHKLCSRVGIKPLLGCEFYIVDDVSIKERERNHIILIAKNYIGYKNLLKLSTKSHLEGFYYRPRIDRKMLLEHHEGLIATSACMLGRVSEMILKDIPEDKIKVHLNWWKTIFGDDYYIELQPDKLEEYIKINPVLVRLAKEMDIKTVTSNDVHYPEKTDKLAHDVLLGIQKKKTLAEQPGFSSDMYWIQSKKDIRTHFEKYHPTIHYSDYESAIRNTQEIADKVEMFDIKGEFNLPEIARPINNPLDVPLVSEKRPEYIERYKYESDVIKKLGFENYFLLISDIVNWAKEKGIQVGPGRGSVAGSLIAYWMGITGVDPIKHDLLFERFLNQGRKVAPDIDIDFDASRRDEVLDYIKSKWKTAKISTYISIQGKGSIKDCCRTFGISYGVAEIMSRAFPTRQTLNMTIDRAILTEMEFKRFYLEYPDMFKSARRLEGRIKTTGVHPAGIIISDMEVSDIVALRYSAGSSGEPVVQCDMEDVDFLGLLKVDCLGSKTQTTLSIAKELSGVKHLDNIPLDDEQIFKEFKKGNCWDIFQFQSELGHDTVIKVKPDNFETLTAITALVRPGAYDFIDDFAKGDYEPIMENLKPILKDTRNIILYQEQTMKIAVDIAGFSLDRADDLRKAIGKKKADQMASLRKDFIQGGINKGYSGEVISQLFKIIEKSSNYAFNKSHAVAYTLNSYWCVSGETRIYDAERHQKIKISEAYKLGLKKTLFLDDDGKIRIGKIRKIIKSRKRLMYRLSVNWKNNSIVASLEHKFWTRDGWKDLGSLRVGNEVLISTKKIDERQKAQKISKAVKYDWALLNRKEREEKLKGINNLSEDELRARALKCANVKKRNGYFKTKKFLEQLKEQHRKQQEKGGFGYGNVSYASDGHICHSDLELQFEEWLIKNRIKHKPHPPIGNGKYGDQLLNNWLYVEVDGMNRSDDYFHRRYGKDKDYIVLKGKNKKLIISKNLKRLLYNTNDDFSSVRWVKIKSIEEVGWRDAYDISMDIEEGASQNYIANSFIVHNCMWFKVNHPIEWATAELSVQVEDEEKLKKYLEDAIKNGITLLPPDINKSEWGFTKEEKSIRCGIGMVKKFSTKGYAELVAHRPYSSFLDFMNRISGVRINKGAVQSLVKAGVFDSFRKGRKPLYDLVEQFKKKKGSAGKDLFLKDEEWTPKQMAKMEKEALGFYISGHPILHYKDKLIQFGINIKDGLGETGSKSTIKVAGIIDGIKVWNSKNGEMAFVDISGFQKYSLNLWHNAWVTYKNHISIGDMIIVEGHKLETRNKIGVETEKGDLIRVI